MIKEEFEQYVKQEEFPLELFYKYWNDVKPVEYKELTLEEFEKEFPLFIQQHTAIPIITPKGEPKRFNYEYIIDKIFNYYKNKTNEIQK